MLQIVDTFKLLHATLQIVDTHVQIAARNISQVESRSTSAILQATNFIVRLPSATLRAMAWRNFQSSANQVSHLCVTADQNRRTSSWNVARNVAACSHVVQKLRNSPTRPKCYVPLITSGKYNITQWLILTSVAESDDSSSLSQSSSEELLSSLSLL